MNVTSNTQSGRRLLGLVAVTAAMVLAAMAVTNGEPDTTVAQTPPMGWNNWNSFGCNVSETLVKETADKIVSSGLADSGYENVVVDDCWFDPQRDANGNLQANAERFPSGMKALGDYLHANGLKFGIYQVPTDKTCAQRSGTYPGATGSQGYEVQDAQQFAAWGVDYLKYDWCSPMGTIEEQVAAFETMRDALRATGRRIVYSINPNSYHAITGPLRDWSDVANMWRTTEDITTSWDTGNTNAYPMGIKNIIAVNSKLHSYAAPGGFNDPDMLEVGVGGLTVEEQKTHFAMWAQMAAPLLIGADLRTASRTTFEILSNKALIAIDQDPLGLQAKVISDNNGLMVLSKPLVGGHRSVALYNATDTAATVATDVSEAGLRRAKSYRLQDVWSGATKETAGQIRASVPARGTVMYLISACEGSASTSQRRCTASSWPVQERQRQESPLHEAWHPDVKSRSYWPNDYTEPLREAGHSFPPAGWTSSR